ncbi:hypothetical protein [Methylocystis sp.]|uniref:hypothetical protein n=1 Tax=Methylocystis sp. TaxID=1911079 RepID=UPI0025F082A9|nr:hypothetical protein [Methylocystis sp.]
MSNITKLADVRDRRRGKVPHYVDVLSFMKRRKPKGTGIDCWAVKPSGSYSRDYETGRALGREYLAFIGRYPTNGNATLLNCIVRDMAERGRVGGLEFGFLNCVNEYAMFAASTVASVEARR